MSRKGATLPEKVQNHCNVFQKVLLLLYYAVEERLYLYNLPMQSKAWISHEEATSVTDLRLPFACPSASASQVSSLS